MRRSALPLWSLIALIACEDHPRVRVELEGVPPATRRLQLALAADGEAYPIEAFHLSPPLASGHLRAELRLAAPIRQGFTVSARAFGHKDDSRRDCLIALGSTDQEGPWAGSGSVSLGLRAAWTDAAQTCVGDSLRILDAYPESQRLTAGSSDVLHVTVAGLLPDGGAQLLANFEPLALLDDLRPGRLSARVCPAACASGPIALQVRTSDGVFSDEHLGLSIERRRDFVPQQGSAPGGDLMAVQEARDATLVAISQGPTLRLLRPVVQPIDEVNQVVLETQVTMPLGDPVTALAFLPPTPLGTVRLLVARGRTLQLLTILAAPPALAVAATFQAQEPIQHLAVVTVSLEGAHSFNEAIAITAAGEAQARVLLFPALDQGSLAPSLAPLAVPGPVALLATSSGGKWPLLLTVREESAILTLTLLGGADPAPPPQKLPLGVIPAALLVADLDHDGRDELLVVGQRGDRAFLQVMERAGQGFTEPTQELELAGGPRARVLSACDADPETPSGGATTELLLASVAPAPQATELARYRGYALDSGHPLRLVGAPLPVQPPPALLPAARGLACVRGPSGPRSILVLARDQVQVLRPGTRGTAADLTCPLPLACP